MDVSLRAFLGVSDMWDNNWGEHYHPEYGSTIQEAKYLNERKVGEKEADQHRQALFFLTTLWLGPSSMDIRPQLLWPPNMDAHQQPSRVLQHSAWAYVWIFCPSCSKSFIFLDWAACYHVLWPLSPKMTTVELANLQSDKWIYFLSKTQF